MTDQTGKPSARVFISYSRKDKEFVKKLNDGLDSSGVDAWVDWEGIPLSADWMAEITRAIEGADAFLFVISPDSLASKVCADELELGINANKKLIPILYRQPKKGTAMHANLSATNWVYLRDQDDFSATLPKLLDAIRTDLEWVHQHTRLYQRAVEWRDKNRNASFLLQGSDLTDAESWLSEGATKEDRVVHPLQVEYVQTSRKMAVRRQRNLLIGVSFAFVLSVALGIFALLSRNEAVTQRQIANDNAQTAVANERARATQQYLAEVNESLAIANENLAKAQSSVAQAQTFQSQANQLDTSTLLAIDSWRRAPSFEAQDILRANISLLPAPVQQLTQGDEISNIRFSPDGTQFVTTSLDSTACVWNLANPETNFCVTHDDDVAEGLFTLDGISLVTGSADASVRVWNLSDHTQTARYDLGAAVYDLDLSPDGRLLAAGLADGTVSVLDLVTGREIYTMHQSGSIYVVTFSPAGTWLAMGTSGGFVGLWKVHTEILISGPKHEAEVYALVFSPDSRWLVSAGADKKARMASVSLAGQRYEVSHSDWVEDVAFSPDSSWFVTVGDDNKIKVWETSTGRELRTMSQENFVQKVRVSPDGEWIATTGKDKTVRIWNVITGGQMMRIPLAYRGSALAFSLDGSQILVGDSGGNISVWDVSALSMRANYLEFPEYTNRAVFSPGSNGWLLVNSDDKKVWLFNEQQMLESHQGTTGSVLFSSKELIYDMVISPDLRWVAVAELLGNRAILYDMETGQTISLRHRANVNAVAFSANGLQIATADGDGVVMVWDVNTGEPLFEFVSAEPVFSIAWAGNLLAAGSRSQLQVYDTETRELVLTLAQLGDIKDVAFSPDGQWLASASTEGMVHLWAVQNGTVSESAVVLKHNDEVLSLGFSPDSTLLATGSQNGFAYLWDMTTFDEIARFPHATGVTSVSFSFDGKWLAAVSRNVVQVWAIDLVVPVTTQGIVETACAHLTANFSEEQWQIFFYEEPYLPLCENLPVGGE